MPAQNIAKRQSLSGQMTVEELRSRIFANKESRRAALARLPILEKFRIVERMKEDAGLIRNYRKKDR